MSRSVARTPLHHPQMHHQVHYSDPTQPINVLQLKLRRLLEMVVQDGFVADVGHTFYMIIDNRKQWEQTHERPHWLKTLVCLLPSWPNTIYIIQGWAVLRSAGGQVLRGLLTKQMPSILESPRGLLIIVACWALVNYSKDDIIYKLFNRQPFKTIGYLLEALYCAKEVSLGTESFLKNFPDYNVAAMALGVISGAL